MMKDSEAWTAAIHGVAKSWTQLSYRTTITNYRNKKQLVSFLPVNQIHLTFYTLIENMKLP